MKNYTSKPLHVKPQTQHSFKKSQRKYPDPINVKNLSNKVIDSKIHMQQQAVMQPQHYKTQPIFIHSSQNKKRFHFMAQEAYPIYDRNTNNTYTDPQCIWFRNLERTPNGSRLMLKINKNQYILSNWTQDYFPTTIFICIDGFYGYLDKQGNPTDRVGALRIVQMNSCFSQTNQKNYELRYSIPETIIWQIPKQLTNLKMKIKVDAQEQPVQLPLPNQMVIDLQIYQTNQ